MSEKIKKRISAQRKRADELQRKFQNRKREKKADDN